jgi:hypothetical protein
MTTTTTPTTTTRTAPGRTLGYQSPATRRDADQLSIGAAVKERELSYQAAATTMFLAGAAALVVGEMLLATFVCTVAQRFHPRGHAVLTWWNCFVGVLTLLTPLLFWWERRTAGRWFEEEIAGQGAARAGLWQSASRGEWELRTSAASLAGFIEILLWGPRMIISACARWREKSNNALVTDAAAVVHYLRLFDGGIGVHELPTARPQPVLRYLVARDWVGVSKAADRVWLLSDARKKLNLE